MRTNLHSSQAYSKFAYAQHPEWMGLLQSTEEPLLRLRDTAIHTVGLLIFNCLSVRPPLHFQEPEVLRPIINLRVRAHRHFKFPDMEGQAPTLRMDAITDNDFPNGRSTLLPETLFLVIRRYTEGNNGKTLVDGFHGSRNLYDFQRKAAAVGHDSHFRRLSIEWFLNERKLGPMAKLICELVKETYRYYGLPLDQVAMYFRVIEFEAEEFAFVGLEMDNTTTARFVDQFSYTLIPPF